jgi:hypothetical protein
MPATWFSSLRRPSALSLDQVQLYPCSAKVKPRPRNHRYRALSTPVGLPAGVSCALRISDQISRRSGDFCRWAAVLIRDHGDRSHELPHHLGRFRLSAGSANEACRSAIFDLNISTGSMCGITIGALGCTFTFSRVYSLFFAASRSPVRPMIIRPKATAVRSIARLAYPRCVDASAPPRCLGVWRALRLTLELRSEHPSPSSVRSWSFKGANAAVSSAATRIDRALVQMPRSFWPAQP